MPGIEELKRHASKYGPDGVIDAARDAWAHECETTEQLVARLTSLQKEIDTLISKPEYRKQHHLTKPGPRQPTAEQRVKKLLGIVDEPEQEQ